MVSVHRERLRLAVRSTIAFCPWFICTTVDTIRVGQSGHGDMKRNLVIVPVGRVPSCHKAWVSPKRQFDLLLVNYSDVPNLYREDGDYYFAGSGFKYELIRDGVDAYHDQIRHYEYIWLPDDDLAIGVAAVNNLFEICRAYELDLAQPAVKNAYASHAITRRRLLCRLRFVNFVELMCPLFKREAFFQVLDTFRINRSGYGIDWIWADRLSGKRIAIIDEIGVVHTKKLFAGDYYKKLHALNIDAMRECQEVFSKFGLSGTFIEHGRVVRSLATRWPLTLLNTAWGERALLSCQTLYYMVTYREDDTRRQVYQRWRNRLISAAKRAVLSPFRWVLGVCTRKQRQK